MRKRALGIAPVRLLCERSRNPKGQLLRFEGMPSLMALPLRRSRASVVKLPRDIGMEPDRCYLTSLVDSTS